MKEKILRKETVKVETEVIVDQETICANMNNLSSTLANIGETDGHLFIGDKFDELKTNILNALYVLSTHLITEEQP